MRYSEISLLFILGFTALPQGNQSLNGLESGGPKLPDYLVDSEWLSENLNKKMVVLDTRASIREYKRGHVPGAQYVPRRHYLARVNGIPGMFSGVEKSVKLLEDLGISNDTPVVVYDEGSGMWAARLAWTLAYLGHEKWAVLDGGYGLWKEDEYESSKDTFIPQRRGDFRPDIQSQILISGEGLLKNLNSYLVLDVRSDLEYQGKILAGFPCRRRGHIPGSQRIEWTMNNSNSELPTMLRSDELEEFYESQGVGKDDSIVTVCYVGIRAAYTWLALTIAGYKDVALYDGSWVEWCKEDKYPVEK